MLLLLLSFMLIGFLIAFIVVAPHEKLAPRLPVVYSVARRVEQRVRSLSEELLPPSPFAADSEPTSPGRLRRASLAFDQMADFVLHSAAQLLIDAATKALLADEVVRHFSISEVQEGDVVGDSSGPRSPRLRGSRRSRELSGCGADDRMHAVSLASVGEAEADGLRRSSSGSTASGERPPYTLRHRSTSGSSMDPLPKFASAFVGTWRPVRSAHYGTFLQEVAGLPWAVRKIAERMPLPSPIVSIVDGRLHCETVALGAKPVHEVLEPGESEFFEPNMGCEYAVSARWDGAVFIATRRSSLVNGGRPTEQRRWVDASRNCLVIRQSWGGAKDFVAEFVKEKS